MAAIDLLVQLLPLVLQGQLSVDDDVYFPGPGLHGGSDLLQSGGQCVLTAGEACGHRGNWNVLSLIPERSSVKSCDKYRYVQIKFIFSDIIYLLLQQLHTLLDSVGIDTDSSSGDASIQHVHGLQQILPDGPGSLETQPGHVGLRVIPSQCGQINAGHRLQQPGCLPLLLHCPPGAQGGCSPVVWTVKDDGR